MRGGVENGVWHRSGPKCPPFLTHYADRGFPAVDNFLLLVCTVLKWVSYPRYPRYPQLSTVIHSAQHMHIKGYPWIIHGLSTKLWRTRPLARAARTLKRIPNALSLLWLLGRHSHAKGCNTMRQRLAGQQPPGGLNRARWIRIRWSVCTRSSGRNRGTGQHASATGRQLLLRDVLVVVAGERVR